MAARADEINCEALIRRLKRKLAPDEARVCLAQLDELIRSKKLYRFKDGFADIETWQVLRDKLRRKMFGR